MITVPTLSPRTVSEVPQPGAKFTVTVAAYGSQGFADACRRTAPSRSTRWRWST